MNDKRVTVLSGIYPPDSGGPATFAVSFSEFIVKKGRQAKVISLTDGPGSNQRNQRATVKLISRDSRLMLRTVFVVIEIYREFMRKSDVIANGFFVETYIASIFLRRTYTAKVPGDIVWERAFNSGITTLDVRSFQNQKLVLKYKLFRFLFTKSLLKARSVIVPSPVLYELCLLWGLPQTKLHLIYNSVDIDIFKPAEIIKFKYDCIVVNRLVGWKNVNDVIIACSNKQLSLLVVGDGPEMHNLKALAKTLDAKIDFVGNASQTELIEHLHRSRFYILNSTADATAYSLLEARSCGLIAIANIETGAAEIIAHKKDGYLTRSTTHKEVEEAIEWLLSKEPSSLQKMREAARDSTVKDFNKNNNFEKILDLAASE